MANVSIAIIVADAVKDIANGAVAVIGWQPPGGDSFYLGASPGGDQPITHWYLRVQASPENAALLDAITAAQWPDSGVVGVSSWESVGLDADARTALSTGLEVDIRDESQLAVEDWEYGDHVSSVLADAELFPVDVVAPV